jgi:hypothetical protein
LHGKDEDQFLCGAVREVGQHMKAVSKFPGKEAISTDGLGRQHDEALRE